MTQQDGIPVTTPSRTLLDLRRTLRPHRWRRALRQAEVLGLEVGEFGADGTRSELETMFLRLCARHRLAAPEVNVRIGGLLVDFLWRDARLVVETDGYRFHRGRAAFESDRERDLRLRALGFDVLRFSYRQVAAQPERVVSAVRAAL